MTNGASPAIWIAEDLPFATIWPGMPSILAESDALLPGQFPEALGVYMEMVKSRTGGVSDMTFAVLHDLRAATLD